MQSIAITVTMISVADAMRVRIAQRVTTGVITVATAETALKQSAIAEAVAQIVQLSVRAVQSSAKTAPAKSVHIVTTVKTV